MHTYTEGVARAAYSQGGRPAAAIDVVTGEILSSKLAAVVADMGATLVNTAHSAFISQARDYSNAILTADGQVVATDDPLHLACLSATAARILDRFEFDLDGEDVVITNDPYSGGVHVQDFLVIAPVAYQDAIVLYLGVRAHLVDIGGEAFGGYALRARELWAEGARITPIKLYRGGKLQRDVLTTVLLNSRVPDIAHDDLEAMVAAVRVGKQRLEELFDRFGLATVLAAAQYSLDYTERLFRTQVRTWPNGEYTGQRTLDHDGRSAQAISVRVRLTVLDDALELDFGESDKQSQGIVNSTPSNTSSHALLPLYALLDESLPKNGGLLRVARVSTRRGTVVDPEFPAPTGWSPVHVGNEISGAVADALASFLPDRVGAVSASVPLAVAVHGVGPQRVLNDFGLWQGGASASAQGDGWGMPGPLARRALPSIELYESQFRDTVLGFELATDSGGPGRFRGGPGTDARIRLAPAGCTLSVAVAGRAHPAPGMAGGCSGGRNRVLLVEDGGAREVETAVDRLPVAAPTELALTMGGGGGWGDPLERDPALVLRDVLDELVSIEAARRDYGVIVDPERFTVNDTATLALRQQRRGAAESTPTEESDG